MPAVRKAAAGKENRKSTLSALLSSDAESDAAVDVQPKKRARTKAPLKAINANHASDDDEIAPPSAAKKARSGVKAAKPKRLDTIKDAGKSVTPVQKLTMRKTQQVSSTSEQANAVQVDTNVGKTRKRKDVAAPEIQAMDPASPDTPAAAKVSLPSKALKPYTGASRDPRFDSLLEKYESLKSKRVTEAERLFANYKTAAEQRFKSSDELIQALRTELREKAASAGRGDERKLAQSEEAAAKLKSQVQKLQAQLQVLQTQNNKATNPNSSPTNLEDMLNLYVDLSGLFVRDVKRTGNDIVYDCIHSGKNGSKSHNFNPR